jgi:hypothetical protein
VDHYGADTPIRSVVISGKNGKVTVKGKGAMLPSLSPVPDSYGVVVSGDGDRFCAMFGGIVSKSIGTNSRWKAVKAPLAAGCPN